MKSRNDYSYKKEAEVITVPHGWKIIKAPNIIETTGLGPCVGIIIYDPETKQAMVGHFADPMVERLNKMIDTALKVFHNKEVLKIYIGG